MAEEIDVQVDPKVCTGSQLCTVTAPGVFVYDDDLQASKAVTSPVEATDAVWAAIEGCPVEAIRARDAVTGDQRFP